MLLKQPKSPNLLSQAASVSTRSILSVLLFFSCISTLLFQYYLSFFFEKDESSYIYYVLINLIPVLSSIMYLFSCLFWFLYAIFIKDFYLAFPNILGVILSSSEIALYLNCKKKYPGIGERDTIGTIDIVTGANDDKKEETPIKIDEQGEGKPVEIVNKLDN